MHTFPHLEILHGVPVVFHKDDCVGAGEIEPEAAHAGGQQQQVDAGIRVEAGDEAVAGGRGHRAVQPQVGQAGQVHLHTPNQSISFNPVTLESAKIIANGDLLWDVISLLSPTYIRIRVKTGSMLFRTERFKFRNLDLNVKKQLRLVKKSTGLVFNFH